MSGADSYVPRVLSGTAAETSHARPQQLLVAPRVLSSSSSQSRRISTPSDTKQRLPSAGPSSTAPPSSALHPPLERKPSASRPTPSASNSQKPTPSASENAHSTANASALTDQDRRRQELRAFVSQMEQRPDPLADVDMQSLQAEPSAVFERTLQLAMQAQDLRRAELRSYLAVLQHKTESDSAAALVEFPATFGQLVQGMIAQYRAKGFSALPLPTRTLHPDGPTPDAQAKRAGGAGGREDRSTAGLAMSGAVNGSVGEENPGLVWSMDPQLRQGLDVILEMDRRLEALEGRGAAEGARPSSKASSRSTLKGDATDADARSDRPSLAPSAALSAASRAPKLRPADEALIDRIVAMDEAELAAYLADPYEELLAPPGPRGGAGELEGLLSLADINQRMLEYSAAHGWGWESLTDERVHSWVPPPPSAGGPSRPSTAGLSAGPSRPLQPPPATPAVSTRSARPSTSASVAVSKAPSLRRRESFASSKGTGAGGGGGGGGSAVGAQGGAGAVEGWMEMESEKTVSQDYLTEQREMREMQKRQHEIDLKLLDLKAAPIARGALPAPDLSRLLAESSREIAAAERFRRLSSHQSPSFRDRGMGAGGPGRGGLAAVSETLGDAEEDGEVSTSAAVSTSSALGRPRSRQLQTPGPPAPSLLQQARPRQLHPAFESSGLTSGSGGALQWEATANVNVNAVGGRGRSRPQSTQGTAAEKRIEALLADLPSS